MKKIFGIIFILLFGISALAQKGGIEILETGGFHGEEITAKTGEIWLGLFRQNENFVLLPSVITVEEVNDPIVDGPEDRSGKEVKVLGREAPLFLIRGRGFVQSREVKTVFAGPELINRNFNRDYEFSGQKYNLRVEGEKGETPENLNQTSALVLSRGEIKQVLYKPEKCDDCVWQINWAGDIDGDGRLDFYMYLTDHYNVARMKLFLSSSAGKGALVKEAAEFVTTGC
ncbi:MAG: hypothetical protein R2747_02910 [Pyrinomonadaceae bacterium]